MHAGLFEKSNLIRLVCYFQHGFLVCFGTRVYFKIAMFVFFLFNTCIDSKDSYSIKLVFIVKTSMLLYNLITTYRFIFGFWPNNLALYCWHEETNDNEYCHEDPQEPIHGLSTTTYPFDHWRQWLWKLLSLFLLKKHACCFFFFFCPNLD